MFWENMFVFMLCSIGGVWTWWVTRGVVLEMHRLCRKEVTRTHVFRGYE